MSEPTSVVQLEKEPSYSGPTALAPADPLDPLALVQRAIDSNWDLERIGKLMELQEKWETRKAAKAFSDSMSACQAELPRIANDRNNTHTKSDYTSLDAILEDCNPILGKYGLSVGFSEVPCDKADMVGLQMEIRHRDGHVEVKPPTYWPLDLAGSQGTTNKTRIQAKGSSITYARRYMFCAAFNVAVKGSDQDGNAPPAALTPEQIGVMNDLLVELESMGTKLLKPFVPAKFFAWIGCKGLSDFPANRFTDAVAELNRKRKAVKP